MPCNYVEKGWFVFPRLVLWGASALSGPPAVALAMLATLNKAPQPTHTGYPFTLTLDTVNDCHSHSPRDSILGEPYKIFDMFALE